MRKNYELRNRADRDLYREMDSHLPGFSVMMAAGHELFDLVAWRGKVEMIFLLVKSSRSPVSIGSYRPEVRKLSSIVKENSHPGEIQFWIKSWNEWLRYRIMPGGAVSIGGDLL